MEAANVSAIISATAGIVGVLLGNSFVAIKEFLGARHVRSKDAQYLAILVMAHLDRFATGCLNVAFDDGTEEGRPAGRDGEYHQATVDAPKFDPLELEVEWKSLPSDLMYRILDIPNKQELLHGHLSDEWQFDDAPDYPDYFYARRHDYAQLGLEVAETAKRLRKHARLPTERGANADATIADRLKEQMEKLTKERAERQQRIEANRKAYEGAESANVPVSPNASTAHQTGSGA